MKEHKRHIGLDSEFIRMSAAQLDLSYKALGESVIYDRLDYIERKNIK